MTDATPLAGCQEGRDEISGGLASLMTALFLFAWSGFDLAIVLVGAAPLLFGRRFFSHVSLAKAVVDPFANHVRPGGILSNWRLLAQIVFAVVLAILAAVRIVNLVSGNARSVAHSDFERWLPYAFSSLVPLWFLMSGLLNRLPRHLLAALVGLAGAAIGPLLALAWRDSLALAALVMGIVLIADGSIAWRQLCHAS